MAYTAQSKGVASRPGEAWYNLTPITPANGAQIGPFSGFIVGANGAIVICPVKSATTVTLTVIAGIVYRIPIQGVDLTGTTATGIVGLS